MGATTSTGDGRMEICARRSRTIAAFIVRFVLYSMTELEGCVLGVVWLRGPCTAYLVRREFLQSQSSHWSGSGGAIYPLLRRLEKQKLLRSRSRTWGTGRKELYEITRRGVQALQAWLGPPLEPWTARPTFDPIRTRMSFFGALSPAKRRRFLAEAQKNAATELREVERSEERRVGKE